MKDRNHRPRLVYVIRSANVGGVEQHVIGLIKAFRERYDIVLVSLTNEPTHELFRNLGIQIHKLRDQTQQSLSTLSNFRYLTKLLRDLEPDVLHLHGIRPIFFGSIAGRIAGTTQIVATFHSSHQLMAMTQGGQTSVLKLAVSKLLHLTGIALSTRTIAVSDNLRRELLQLLKAFLFLPYFFNRSKLSVIHNGIDFEHFNARRTRQKAPAEATTVGFVGRLDPKKGVQFLIAAIAQLRREGLNVELHVVGDGWDADRLKAIADDNQLRECIKFLGHHEDIASVARDFDIFVLPSLSEGMPLTIMEMMALGVPVVATNVGGIPEQIEDGITGILVAKADSHQLAYAIRRLADDPALRDRLATGAVNAARNLFDEKSMIQKTEALYLS